ncbi:MAG: peptidase M50 [Mycobacteriaceae bacterium]
MHAVPARPGSEHVDPLLEHVHRLVVLGDDADVAAVLLRLLRTERLDVEVAVVGVRATALTRTWSLPTGPPAARAALRQAARVTPLLRTTQGGVVAGEATVRGLGGAALHGEAYADDALLFSGDVPAVQVGTGDQGVRARVRGRVRRGPWLSARALQLGSTGADVITDGVPQGDRVPRWSFYRHTVDWRLVRP